MIVVDGLPPLPGWKALVAPTATVIAADGGARHARREAVRVTDLVGDLDSLTAHEVDWFHDRGARVHRFAADKDFTDFELAARLAADHRPHGHSSGRARLLVVGGAGGRLDHALGNIVVLAGADLADFAVTASIGEAAVQPASPARGVTAYGSAGDTVSLLPLFGDAHGVSTVGLRYRLDAATLDAEAARGVSNTIATPPAKVVVEEGTVAVVEPRGTARLLATHHPPGGRP